jgi:thiol-disulfide isomerase/thioredoxin
MKHLLLCLLLPSLIIAQHRPLSVGDKLPPEVLKTLNYKPQTANSLIILDFFATFCTTCIKELPKLDSLQQKFSQNLQLIIVAYESLEKLNMLKKKNKLFADCTLPIIAGDSILVKLFPHNGLPHEVWIGHNGKVLAITDQYEINERNISAFINGEGRSLPVKIDALDFDSKKPLLVDNNGGTDDKLLFQSKLTSYLPGIASSTGIDRSNGFPRWYIINFPLIDLYREALGFTPNRMSIQLKDDAGYFVPLEPSQEWKKEYLFSWELIARKNTTKEYMQGLLLEDLNRYFGLFGRMEKRKTKCLAITRINKADTSLKTKQAKPSIKYGNEGEVIFTNQPIGKLLQALNTSPLSKPAGPVFLDETGLSFNIDITLPQKAKKNIDELKKFLLSHQLRLEEVEREIEMFILSEVNQSKN